MLSEKQLLANRQNALRSTGPRTAEGRAIASQNAIKHGLRAENTVIAGEDPQEFDQFRHLLLDDLAPEGAMEVFLADRIVAGFWKLRRAGRIETEILTGLHSEFMLQHKQQLEAASGPTFGDALLEDFPFKFVFNTCQDAQDAWDRTPDGITCAEGKMDRESAENSFLNFLR